LTYLKENPQYLGGVTEILSLGTAFSHWQIVLFRISIVFMSNKSVEIVMVVDRDRFARANLNIIYPI
jgi:hypothetical protein